MSQRGEVLACGHTAWPQKASQGGGDLEMEGVPGKTKHPLALQPRSGLCCMELTRSLCPLGCQQAGTASFPLVGRNNKRGPCLLPPTARIVPSIYMPLAPYSHDNPLRWLAWEAWRVGEGRESLPAPFSHFLPLSGAPLDFSGKGWDSAKLLLVPEQGILQHRVQKTEV